VKPTMTFTQVTVSFMPTLKEVHLGPSPADVANCAGWSDHPTVDDYQVVAQELSEPGGEVARP
jgi:hypothetical protein